MNKRIAGVLVSCVVAAMVAVPGYAALKAGAAAPDFTATASQAGKDFTFSLKQALAKGPVVVYFYPAAYTGGCDLEAHTFATEKDKFSAAGATIGKFAVASDPDGKIATQYDLKMMPPQKGVTDVEGKPVTHGFFPRTTFVIDRDGKVVSTFSSKEDQLTPDEHVKRSLAIVQRMHSDKAP